MTSIEALKEGLNEFGLLRLMQQHPHSFKGEFCGNGLSAVTAIQFFEIYIQRLGRDLNRHALEEERFQWFKEYLQSRESEFFMPDPH